MHKRAVALSVTGGKRKAHRAADCHHEGIIRHGLCKLIQTHHRVKADHAQKQAGGHQRKSRFKALNERPNRHQNDCYGNPSG